MDTKTSLNSEDAGTEKHSRTRQLAQSTLIVMMAFAAAKAISLAQTFVIAQVFGVGGEWDAFVTANRIPELIFTLISGGALSHAFIPIFSSYLARGSTEQAWRIASHVINSIFSLTLVVSIIVFFASPWLVDNVVAPGFSPEAAAQTVELMRILLISTLIFSISGIAMGILQSHNRFLLPALAPIMFDIGILIGVIVLMKPLGVTGIALGAVLGAAMHLGIQIPGLIRQRARWWPELGLNDPVLWRVVRLMLPRIAGLGVFSLNFIIMNNIASRLGEGSVSALDWGWRLMQIPQTLLGTAMGVVIFPTLAALSEVGDENGKREAMSGALRFILATSIPSAVGLIVIGQPLIGLLERGAFDASASALVYSTLSAFTLGLIVHSALEIVARSFYADKDTLTPLWAALIGAAANLVLSFMLSGVQQVEASTLYNSAIAPFSSLGFQPQTGSVSGLALANSIGVGLEVIVLLFILRRRWHGVRENELARTTLKTLAASLVMALGVILMRLGWEMAGLNAGGFVYDVAQVGVLGLGGASIFVITAALLRLNELHELLALVPRRRTHEIGATA